MANITFFNYSKIRNKKLIPSSILWRGHSDPEARVLHPLADLLHVQDGAEGIRPAHHTALTLWDVAVVVRALVAQVVSQLLQSHRGGDPRHTHMDHQLTGGEAAQCHVREAEVYIYNYPERLTTIPFTHSHTNIKVNHAGRQPARREPSGWDVSLGGTSTLLRVPVAPRYPEKPLCFDTFPRFLRGVDAASRAMAAGSWPPDIQQGSPAPEGPLRGRALSAPAPVG